MSQTNGTILEQNQYICEEKSHHEDNKEYTKPSQVC